MGNNNPSWFVKADKTIVSIFKFVSIFSGIFLLAIMLMAFFNVLGEKVLHHGIPSAMEWIQNMHVPVVFFATAYVTLDMGHTKIDLISKKFPEKVQKIFALIGYVLGVFICAYVGYSSIPRMMNALTRNEHSSTAKGSVLIWPFICILILGFFLLSLSFIWSIVRLYVGKGNDKPDMMDNEEVKNND